MLPVPISTVDELLKLGGKIADIVTIILNRRATTEEQKQTRAIVEQFNQIRRTHLDIRTLVEEYNRKIGQAFLQGNVQALFPLCTHQGFKEIEQLYAANTQSEIVYQELVAFDLLSVKLMTQMWTETSPVSAQVISQQWAEAYTCEKWMTVYQTGAKRLQEVVNRYQIARQDETWKVHHSEVFTKVVILPSNTSDAYYQ